MKNTIASLSFVDIHCHILPGIDDGARTWDDALDMARLAVANGTDTIIATPHQLGNYNRNEGDTIRDATRSLQQFLQHQQIPLRVLPGADVRIEPDLATKVKQGSVLSLADRQRHVLLELPHELYFPIEPVNRELRRERMIGILSHPERNQGLLANPDLVGQLVHDGCLMQITAGSLNGTFGPASQALCESMLSEGLVHFIASDGHGPKSRRPLMEPAFHRAAELIGEESATQICMDNPRQICIGGDVTRVTSSRRQRASFRWWRQKAA